MRNVNRILLALLCACIFAGCSGSADREKIIGTWNLDQVDNLMSRLQQDDNETGEDADNAPKMSLHFESNGKLRTETNMGAVNQSKQGQWKLISFNENQQVMKVSCTLNEESTEHEIAFVTKDMIKLVPPNMAGTTKMLKFHRQ